MDRLTSRRHPLPVRATAIVMLAALMAAATASQAGIRDLAKKAVKSTGQKAPEASSQAGENVKFDATTVELDGAVIDKLLAAHKASVSAAGTSATSGRPALVHRRDANRAEADELKDKFGGKIWDNTNDRANWRGCVDGELGQIQNRKQQEQMQKMMADPRSADKILKLTAAMNDAQLKGDKAEVERLQKQMLEMTAATHADTVAAEKKCGPEPPILPAAARIAVLDGELAQIDEQIRDIDAKAIKIQTDASGLTERQLAVAWERVGLYLARSTSNYSPPGFSAIELKALAENKDALKAAVAG
jgi:hypothetical protein